MSAGMGILRDIGVVRAFLRGEGTQVGAAKAAPMAGQANVPGRRSQAQPRIGDGLLGPTVEALAGTLGLRDDSTGVHSSRVVTLTSLVGRRLRLGTGSLRDLAYAAELHDIGKVGVPDAVLRKAGPLAAEEWEVVRSHSAWGAELIEKIPGLERVATIVRHHHERYDGRGYPDRLEGEDIPVESRILAVADAFVAMTEDRPYRRALSEEAAVRELHEHGGLQFDPGAVEALTAELEQGLALRAVGAG
jgi:HD-GYP domain-containing protein (c-di-GMP phosphodiesterase class II)